MNLLTMLNVQALRLDGDFEQFSDLLIHLNQEIRELWDTKSELNLKKYRTVWISCSQFPYVAFKCLQYIFSLNSQINEVIEEKTY